MAYSLVVEIIHFALEEGMSTFLDRHDLEKGDVFFVSFTVVSKKPSPFWWVKNTAVSQSLPSWVATLTSIQSKRTVLRPHGNRAFGATPLGTGLKERRIWIIGKIGVGWLADKNNSLLACQQHTR